MQKIAQIIYANTLISNHTNNKLKLDAATSTTLVINLSVQFFRELYRKQMAKMIFTRLMQLVKTMYGLSDLEIKMMYTMVHLNNLLQ